MPRPEGWGETIILDDLGYDEFLDTANWWIDIINSRRISEIETPVFIFSKLSEA